jgi:anti-sigma factor RsiW
MSPIEPHELTAFLDGELPPDRARAIEEALESDATLREELESLALDDAAWRAAAASARFRPEIILPRVAAAPVSMSIPAVIALAVLLAVCKLALRSIEPIAVSFILQGIVLAALLGLVWQVLKRETAQLPAT